jgi:hypothetical protein
MPWLACGVSPQGSCVGSLVTSGGMLRGGGTFKRQGLEEGSYVIGETGFWREDGRSHGTLVSSPKRAALLLQNSKDWPSPVFGFLSYHVTLTSHTPPCLCHAIHFEVTGVYHHCLWASKTVGSNKPHFFINTQLLLFCYINRKYTLCDPAVLFLSIYL